ncbi:MAG TPA: PspC domain-containing protein, partial [Coriobacteriia bacterium]|nr:PspC domain-containing protein [Coriobacteriia bacterium]
MDSEGSTGGGQNLRTVYVVIGVVLIAFGVTLLGGPPIFGWGVAWEMAREATRELRRVAWPLALIVLGVLIIVYSRQPTARLPSGETRLTRSRHKRVFAGVFGGLSDYFSVDVTFLRVGSVLVAFVLNAWLPLLIAYIVAAAIVPKAAEAAAPVPECGSA